MGFFSGDLSVLYIVGSNIYSTTIQRTHCCASRATLSIFM